MWTLTRRKIEHYVYQWHQAIKNLTQCQPIREMWRSTWVETAADYFQNQCEEIILELTICCGVALEKHKWHRKRLKQLPVLHIFGFMNSNPPLAHRSKLYAASFCVQSTMRKSDGWPGYSLSPWTKYFPWSRCGASLALKNDYLWLWPCTSADMAVFGEENGEQYYKWIRPKLYNN